MSPEIRLPKPSQRRGKRASSIIAVPLALAITVGGVYATIRYGENSSLGCLPIAGQRTVTPDKVAHQQGGWRNYLGKDVCIVGFNPNTMQIGQTEEIAEVVNVNTGKTQDVNVRPATIGDGSARISLYVSPELTEQNKNKISALEGIVYNTLGSLGDTASVPVVDFVGFNPQAQG